MDILAQLLRIKVRDDCIADFGGAILDRSHHTEPHAAGEPAPGTIASPRWACEGFLACALTLAPRARGEAGALRGAPPARTRQSQAPEESFVCIAHNDRAAAGPVLQGGAFDRAISKGCRGGRQSPGRALKAQRVFFHTPRTLSRPSWPPVSRANTVASARQLHGEWMEPC
jgi:hypothetical protein